jgi:hypothetical protein
MSERPSPGTPSEETPGLICPACKAEGETSTVHQNGGTISTCMAGSPGYYDERGAWVPGCDPNTHTTLYRCSRGHPLSVVRQHGKLDEVRVHLLVLPDDAAPSRTERR